MKLRISATVLIIFCMSSLGAAPYQGVRGIALSGALHGTLGLNESIYVNPAAFAFAQRYSVEAHSFLAPSQTENTVWTYTGSVVDAHATNLAAGFSYTRREQKIAGGPLIENAYHLAVSKILKEFLALGMTGKYVNQNFPDDEKNHINFDLGSYWVLTPKLQAGLVAHNILGAFENLEREIALGTRLQAWKAFYISVDALKNVDHGLLKDYRLLGGMELARENGLVTQMGLSLSDQSLKNQYSFGLGWSEHKFGIFYGFQNSLDSQRRMTHALSLRAFFK